MQRNNLEGVDCTEDDDMIKFIFVGYYIYLLYNITMYTVVYTQ